MGDTAAVKGKVRRERSMMHRRPKSSSKPKEIPQWKLDMMAEEEPTAKRPREDAASSMLAAVEGPEVAGAEVVAAEESKVEANVEVDAKVGNSGARDYDDDDDDDVDLSAYDFGNDDMGSVEPVLSGLDTRLPTLTREELLLKREQEEGQVSLGGRLDGGRRKPGKKVYIDDSKASQELSLGGERKKDRRLAHEAASRLGMSAFAPGKSLDGYL